MKKLLLITLLLSFASNAQEFEFDSIVNYNSDKDISKEAEKNTSFKCGQSVQKK